MLRNISQISTSFLAAERAFAMVLPFARKVQGIRASILEAFKISRHGNTRGHHYDVGTYDKLCLCHNGRLLNFEIFESLRLKIENNVIWNTYI